MATHPGRNRLLRLLHIFDVAARHGLDEFVPRLQRPPWRWLWRLLPGAWRCDRDRPRAVRLREALEQLGPIFVKFGQLLSARPDVVGEATALELTRLQDRVPPFDNAVARRVIETAYQAPLESRFVAFTAQPVASASVAQVHFATLPDGAEVAVKVLRPGIEAVIDRDLGVLYTLARLVERFWSDGARLRPVEIVEDYDRTIHDELDMMREGANASQLRHNFENSPLIYVPRVYWDHTRREVLVMERIDGIPIRDVEAIRAAGVDLKTLAYNGVEIFFTQAFRDGFFHADMHPGNIFVSPQGQYRAVDFGIMGVLGESDKRYLAEMFLAFFNRDYRQVARAHLRAGWVPPQTRIEEFEAAIRTVCEPIFARPIKEISFGRFVMQLFQTARRFQMPVQPQLVLLQKTLLQIEGLGRTLYPDLDLWDTAKPYLERWMRAQIGPRAALRALRRELPGLAGLAPQLPLLAQDMVRRLRDEARASQAESMAMRRLREELRGGQRRLFYAVVGGALLLVAAVSAAATAAHDVAWLAWLTGLTGVALVAIAWPSARRRHSR